MTSSRAQPSLSAVEAALRTTTERFATELARPSQGGPDWSAFEWQTARAVAAMHGVSPLLAATLRWQGPSEWQCFLGAQRAHTERRHRRIEELLRLIDDATRAAGVPVVALKGAALHALGLYRAGDRPMADLDLLVREEDVDLTSGLLEALGYRATHTYWRHRSFSAAGGIVHGSLGEHADNYLKIELHERICEALPIRRAELTDFVLCTQPRPGLNPYQTNAALMAHLLLHASGNIARRSVRLLHLHDIALLATRMNAGEWEILARHDANTDPPWWALPPLALTAHYYPDAIPRAALETLSRFCPRRLRWSARRSRLTDVSLSRLWIEAFPGISWARSASEAAEYVFKRIFPDHEARLTRKSETATEPGLAQNPWSHLNQRRRILRWMVSRPPRPATMHAVRAALDTSG